MTTNTEHLKASIRHAIEDLLHAEAAETVSIPMGDKLIIAGSRAALARHVGYHAVPVVSAKEAAALAGAPVVEAAPTIPAGWKLVPEKLTPEMLREFASFDVFDCFKDFPNATRMVAESMWSHALKAAPAPGAGQ